MYYDGTVPLKSYITMCHPLFICAWNLSFSKSSLFVCMFVCLFAENKAEKLSTWLLRSGQEFDKKFLDSKQVLKVYFNPSMKNKDFVFLGVPFLPGWLKILFLIKGAISIMQRGFITLTLEDAGFLVS